MAGGAEQQLRSQPEVDVSSTASSNGLDGPLGDEVAAEVVFGASSSKASPMASSPASSSGVSSASSPIPLITMTEEDEESAMSSSSSPTESPQIGNSEASSPMERSTAGMYVYGWRLFFFSRLLFCCFCFLLRLRLPKKEGVVGVLFSLHSIRLDFYMFAWSWRFLSRFYASFVYFCLAFFFSFLDMSRKPFFPFYFCR